MVPPSGECLIKAQEHVFKLMQTDTYSRLGFVRLIFVMPDGVLLKMVGK